MEKAAEAECHQICRMHNIRGIVVCIVYIVKSRQAANVHGQAKV
jgi:hypothetical protein